MLDIHTAVTPPLFFILSFWTGSALLLGVFMWLRDVHNGKYDGESLQHVVGTWLARGLFLTIITSLLSGYITTNGSGNDNPAHYWPELLMLGAFISGIALYNRAQPQTGKDFTRIILLEVFQALFLAIVILMVWSLSYLIHLSMMVINSPFAAFANPLRDAIIVVGTLWIMPFTVLFMRAKNKSQKGEITLPQNFRFQNILWPILLSLIIFMLPLLIETFLHSAKYKKMMNPPQVLRVI